MNRPNLTAQVIHVVSLTWRGYGFEKVSLKLLHQRMLRAATPEQENILRKAGIVQDCSECSLRKLHDYLRGYRDQGKRPFVYVPDKSGKPGVWVHVDGLCYLATLYPELRKNVIRELQGVERSLNAHARGTKASAKAVKARVNELKAGKAFEQPRLLGAA